MHVQSELQYAQPQENTRSTASSFQSKVGLAVNKQRIKETIYMQIKVYHTNLFMLVSPCKFAFTRTKAFT